jgi:D-sedoheptulose 7-phosphate isomerase
MNQASNNRTMGTTRTTILNQINESISVKTAITNSSKILEQVEKISADCLSALRQGAKIIFSGNGGSFADTQHLSAEFTSRYAFDRDSLASLALGCNSSAMSAIGNDYGYEQAFARELSSIAKDGDVYIPISTSGNSPNILASIEIAKKKGIKVYGMTGLNGGKIGQTCECIHVPSNVTGRIQESHIMLGHILCSIIERQYFDR